MRILFLNILADDLGTIEKLDKEVHQGPYSDLFRKKMGIKREELVSINAALELLPDPVQFDGIIIGGSVHNPVPGEEKPWMDKIYEFIREVIVKRIPMLGVCGGHQFIARALGQEIIYNQNGREFGTVEVKLTEWGKEDPLFREIPERFKANLSHRCVVKNIKPEWQLLASSMICEIQAIAINDRTRIIQFHPELDVHHVKIIAEERKAVLIEEGFVKNERDFQKFISSFEKTPSSKKILQNFIIHFVLPSIRR